MYNEEISGKFQLAVVQNDCGLMVGIPKENAIAKKDKKPIKRLTWPLNVVDMRAFSKKRKEHFKEISSWETEGGHA